MSESASATISASQISATDYQYTIVLTDTGTTPLGTFWFGWVPGKDYLDTSPLTVTDPTGWTHGITNFGGSDGFAIQWHVNSTASGEVAAGDSLTFSFTSADTPTQMFGDSSHYAGQSVLTSFVYGGEPFSDNGFEFQVTPLCYLAGTRILTPAGEVPVEDLRAGDLVTTVSGTPRPLRWIGSGRTLVTPRNRDRATPVVVRKHALGEYVPRRDLYITRGHSLYLDGVLIPVEELINHRSIAWVEDALVVEYFHLELDSHDVLVAEGAWAESYREDDNAPLFLNAATRPAAPPQAPFAPVLHDHPTVKRIWRKLSDRAGRLDLTLTDDPDLHLLADGRRLDAEATEHGVYRFRLDRPVRDLRIVSRSAIPSMIGLAQDQRRLGVALRHIELTHAGVTTRLHWDCALLDAGWHAPEPAERHRWTNGVATLPPALPRGLPKGASVELHVCATLPYPVESEAVAVAA